mmetsp:Transcript_20135/g.55820  ORF Transcript_20135/g.55820 Transcript_20135/m.55820 type:complete len:210 (-) Transcript_20135:865-1494(-)
MATERVMAGNPTFMKSRKEMWWPSDSALPAMTMLALAPMRVPLPPKQAPKASAQASGSIEMPSTECTICSMMGTMVAVKGTLSTKALRIALPHMMRPMARYCRDATGASATSSLSVCAMRRHRPSSPRPSIMTKSAAMKSSVSHSTLWSASWQWCMSKAASSHTAPMMDTHAGSRWVMGLRKKDTITHPSTVPHLMRRARSVMGYIFCS